MYRKRSDIEFQSFIRKTEAVYPPWWTSKCLYLWYRELPENTLWNFYMCAVCLFAVFGVLANLHFFMDNVVDAVYNVSYGVHVFAFACKMISKIDKKKDISMWAAISLIIDLFSYTHYLTTSHLYKLGCYYVRLHRPFKYLWSLTDHNLEGSILKTTLKYIYIFMVMRLTWAWVWLKLDELEEAYNLDTVNPGAIPLAFISVSGQPHKQTEFFGAFQVINQMFIPVGASVAPNNEAERMLSMLVMISGCLVVCGAAVASLSLVISLYMRSEETFRSRYRLIIKEMKQSGVSKSVRTKVETFYMMYWHKQKAVSKAKLMDIFPPTLPASIYNDIYFEATQKSRILRDLSYEILSELAMKMNTIHYIPGDNIIKRGTKKSSIIYITHGDVEMLTAEDDSSAILRMTCGTILTPCGGAVVVACGRSHLSVRAATFCTAHVLRGGDLWRVVYKHSLTQDIGRPILAAFTDHLDKVKRHYLLKIPDDSIHKSSIFYFNRNLRALKEMRDYSGKPLLAKRDMFLEIAGCYIMRNRPDASLRDESDEICLRSTFPCILQPSSSLLMTWHSFVAGLILIICITHPYYLVFVSPVPLGFRFFDYVMTGLFVLDLVVHLSTGASVEEGGAITFTETSSRQMRSHWFVLDVMATLPIFEFIGDGHFAGINKLLRLPKVFRVLKLLEENWVYHSNTLRFFSYTLLLFVACYLTAAIQQAFMCFRFNYCVVSNFTHPPRWENKPLDKHNVESTLIYGLYVAISIIMFTSQKVTRISGSSAYIFLMLEVCTVLRIFMEAVYSATIMVNSALREDYDALISTVKKFMIRNQVDPELRQRFITYLELCWLTDKAYKITHDKRSSIFYDLPPHVYQDIVCRNRLKYMLSIPFMKYLSKEELKNISSMAKLFYSSPNEILLNTGDITSEMYVIIQGTCEILSPETQKPFAHLTAKCHFGAVVCLLRLPSYYTVRAITHVQVFCISRKHIMQAANSAIRDVIKEMKTTPEYTNISKRRLTFLYYTPLAPTPNRMYFKQLRKHEPDAEFLQPFNKLGFLGILRYVFPRFTIRPDGAYIMRYEWFRVSCAMCSSMLCPGYMYLSLQWPWLYYIITFLDCTAWFDIVQRMLVGYFNEHGILVYHPASTAAHYLKGAFIVDVFACMPLEDLESAGTKPIERYEDSFYIVPIEQYLMMNRLLQLYRLPSAMMALKNRIARKDILMVMQAMQLFIPFLNVLVSFVILSSVKIYYVPRDQHSIDWFIVPFEDHGGSWLKLFENTFNFNMTASPWNLHLATYFWVTYEATTVGYNCLQPSNLALMKIMFIGMLSCGMLITYFSVRIISIRANVNKPLASFQQDIMDIRRFMKKEKLDADLQKEIHQYYEYNWEKMGGIDYRGVLKLCDQITLRTDAILHIYGPTFAKCPLLSKADVSLLRVLGRAVRSVYFLREMKIIECDDVVSDMYFVDYGGVETRSTDGGDQAGVRLSRGSVFGNLEGSPFSRVPLNIVATSRLHLLMINAEAFYQITKDFPEVNNLTVKYRKSDHPNYILGNLERQVATRRGGRVPVRHERGIIKSIYYQEGLVHLYLVTVCLTCIYIDVYNAGFQHNATWLIYALYALDLCFLVKIVMQVMLPFIVVNQNVKRILLPIRSMYFKYEFKYDIVSCVPIELLAFLNGNYKTRWMMFAWLRLNRMFRIVTVYKCLRLHHERITVNLALFTVVTVFVWFSLFVHTTTTLWYFIGSVEDKLQPNSSWMYNKDGTSRCRSNYICSLYFVITTFTQNGIGDILPMWQSEVIFVSIIQIISTVLLMIYVGEFSNLIQYQSFRFFSFLTKYLELQEFLKNNRVSRNLVKVVNKYTLHLWRESRGKQVPKFLEMAPLSFRLRIMAAIYQHHLDKHQIFEGCEPGFLRQLVGCLRLYTYNEGMDVVKKSEITDSMYLIHTGQVKRTSEVMENTAKIYKTGSSFGVGLIRNTPYTHTYRTMKNSQVLTLCLDDWEHLLQYFPLSKNIIYMNIMKNLNDQDKDPRKWPGGGPSPPSSPGGEYPDSSSVTENLERHLTDKDVIYFPSDGLEENPNNEFMSGVNKLTDAPNNLEHNSDYLEPFRSQPGPIRRSGSMRSSVDENTENNRDTGSLNRDVGDVYKPLQKLTAGILQTLRGIMGRISDTDDLPWTSVTAENTDEHMFEEDVEATVALLQQFDEAKRHTSLTHKKIKPVDMLGKNKSFASVNDYEFEKHIETLSDMDLNLNASESHNDPFALKTPFYIHSSTSNIDNKTSNNPSVPAFTEKNITQNTYYKDAPKGNVTSDSSREASKITSERDVRLLTPSRTSDPRINLTASEISTIDMIHIAADNIKPTPIDNRDTVDTKTLNVNKEDLSLKDSIGPNSTKTIIPFDISDTKTDQMPVAEPDIPSLTASEISAIEEIEVIEDVYPASNSGTMALEQSSSKKNAKSSKNAIVFTNLDISTPQSFDSETANIESTIKSANKLSISERESLIVTRDLQQPSAARKDKNINDTNYTPILEPLSLLHREKPSAHSTQNEILKSPEKEIGSSITNTAKESSPFIDELDDNKEKGGKEILTEKENESSIHVRYRDSKDEVIRFHSKELTQEEVDEMFKPTVETRRTTDNDEINAQNSDADELNSRDSKD